MIRYAFAAALLAAFALPAALALPAAAQDATAGDIVVKQPWARAMPPMSKVGAGYMTLTNDGDAADRLVSVESPRSPDVQIHEMKMEGDVAKMRELNDGLEIPAHSTVTLKPGSYHLMFTGVSDGFEEGETVPATLTFEKAGKVDVGFEVAPVGAPAPAGGMKMDGADGAMKMDHSDMKAEPGQKTE